jgi:2-oxoisovalerate dehydrogenase E1 component beta subunit
VIFFEPKILYRSAVEEVPEGDYEIELGKANIVQSGGDITLVGYGSQLLVLKRAVEEASKLGISCELVDYINSNIFPALERLFLSVCSSSSNSF